MKVTAKTPRWFPAGRGGRARVAGRPAPPTQPRPAACAKHFVGDGGTLGGQDQGNTVCDEATLRKLYLPPYQSRHQSRRRLHHGFLQQLERRENARQQHLLTGVLKGELGFKGFLVSDWAAIDQISPDFKTDIEQSINAGLDMIMIPNGPDQKNNYVEFIQGLEGPGGRGKVSPARIDDAVRRILAGEIPDGTFPKHGN
jgi:beta-glucosidase